MAGADRARGHSWVGHVASILGASALTALAFILLAHFRLTGGWPLWVLLIVLAVASVAGELTSRLIRADARALVLHLAIGSQCMATALVIYAIGWGPTLAVGYLFIAARALDLGGSRTWHIAFVWAGIGTVLGQIAIATGLVSTYVPVPYVHGLAALSILGFGFVMSLLGSKTEQSEIALAERNLAASDTRAALSLLTATLDSTADGILVVDTDGAIKQFNSRFAHMWRIPDDILARGDDSAAIAFVLDQLLYPEMFVAKVEELYVNVDAESDDTLRFKDGRVFHRHSRPQRVDGQVVGRVWSFRDVTDHHRLLEELEHQAFHDSLTGLANRALLRDRLEHALARSRRSEATVTVLFCDLDGFKMVNDTLGHDAGDLLLVEVARRMTEQLREEDTAARLGGDEFAIVLDDTPADEAVALAERLLTSLRAPFVVQGRELSARASIGIADSSDPGLSADSLLSRADIAMYAAKASGRDRCVWFEREMQAELAARHRLHGELRHAVLVDSSLTLHYQPVFDLQSGRVDSLEALVRWNHPTRGLVPPDEFIPIAEETGLIHEIGRFVLEEACRQMVLWRAQPGTSDPSVSVNVSPVQLAEDQFVSYVEAALHRTGLAPTCLVLELTESALLSDTERVHSRLTQLRELGIRVAVDDFGTGYSSLSYLRQFPIDYLKIDRSFVSELGQPSEQARALVRSIIGIGHDLGLRVIAEGIEEPEQLSVLQEEHCDFGQGFLLGRPVPSGQVHGRIQQLLAT
ncbi:MAG TPA: EAL domain-containing protein [Acidimicrobiales bacterium]|nr:EAL domain-containing protein [Acidimicrobiales bacterium]